MAEITSPQIKLIRNSVSINAPKEKVWELLTTTEYTEDWYTEFCPGGVNNKVDWKQGGRAVFTDNTGFGMIGKIKTWKPNEALVFEFDGQIKDGKEDFDSPEAKSLKGAQERYKLTEQNGQTRLDIEADMNAEYFDMMSDAWERALQKVKVLAEK